MDDADVIARSLVDPSAFEELFERHYDRIHRFCRARAGAAADDLVSETFLVAFRRRRDFDLARPSAAPWLFGIALNLVLVAHRRERTRLRLVGRLDGSHDAHESREPFDTGSPVGVALNALAPRDRDLIVLFAWAELSYEQLAEAFDLPIGTVRSRLSRVRRRLRAALAEPVGAVEEIGP